MKVITEPSFKPLMIVLETQEELKQLETILSRDFTVPNAIAGINKDIDQAELGVFMRTLNREIRRV